MTRSRSTTLTCRQRPTGSDWSLFQHFYSCFASLNAAKKCHNRSLPEGAIRLAFAENSPRVLIGRTPCMPCCVTGRFCTVIGRCVAREAIRPPKILSLLIIKINRPAALPMRPPGAAVRVRRCASVAVELSSGSAQLRNSPTRTLIVVCGRAAPVTGRCKAPVCGRARADG